MTPTKKAAPEGGGDVLSLLKEVSHELTTLHGLHATDRPDQVHIPYDLLINIDETDLIRKVEQKISELSETKGK
ncbi:hypothetical protein [Pyramidobacter piscolens]|uniref:hypothetical protein n=1 Tax=Pyramidobacter piscolens TaxID=638849 RepID=UPI001FCAC376|nr:hypothetical protein [Pyramidobacter piscolens]BDF78356.1 hypothetical protein CE91St28_11500 [Pyramidobacter piscolens]